MPISRQLPEPTSEDELVDVYAYADFIGRFADLATAVGRQRACDVARLWNRLTEAVGPVLPFPHFEPGGGPWLMWLAPDQAEPSIRRGYSAAALVDADDHLVISRTCVEYGPPHVGCISSAPIAPVTFDQLVAELRELFPARENR